MIELKYKCGGCGDYFPLENLDCHHVKRRWDCSTKQEYESLKIMLCITCHKITHKYKLITKQPRNHKLCMYRDKFTCVNCGEKEFNFLEVHHLNNKKEDKKSEVFELITVCRKCHIIIHRMLGKPDSKKKLFENLKILFEKKPYIKPSLPFLNYYWEFLPYEETNLLDKIITKSQQQHITTQIK